MKHNWRLLDKAFTNATDEQRTEIFSHLSSEFLTNNGGWTNDYEHLEWEGADRNLNLIANSGYLQDYPAGNITGVDLYTIFGVKLKTPKKLTDLTILSEAQYDELKEKIVNSKNKEERQTLLNFILNLHKYGENYTTETFDSFESQYEDYEHVFKRLLKHNAAFKEMYAEWKANDNSFLDVFMLG